MDADLLTWQRFNLGMNGQLESRMKKACMLSGALVPLQVKSIISGTDGLVENLQAFDHCWHDSHASSGAVVGRLLNDTNLWPTIVVCYTI